MSNILEYFVPFKLAKELAKFGFSKFCFRFYFLYEDRGWVLSTGDFKAEGAVKAPIFIQAFAWVHEEFKIKAWVQPFWYISENECRVDETYSFFIFQDGKFVKDATDYPTERDANIACLSYVMGILRKNYG